MNFKIYVSLLFSSFILLVRPAKAQIKPNAYDLRYDSLKLQLKLQKTPKDSVRVLQQLVDVDNVGLATRSDTSYFPQLLQLNKKVKSIDIQPYELLQKTGQCFAKKQYIQSLSYFQLAVKGFDKQHKIISRLLPIFRILFNQLNDQEGRFHFYQQQLEYYQLNGPVENIAPCYHGLGGYYSFKAAYNLSINNYLKAAELFKKFDPRMYANEIGVIGSIYGQWGNNERAKHYFKSAIPLFLKDKDSSNVAYSYYNLGKILFKSGNYSKALELVNKSLVYCAPAYLGAYVPIILFKSSIYIELNKANLALPLLLKAKAIANSANLSFSNTFGYVETEYSFYEYYCKLNQLDTAEKYLLSACQIAKKAQSTELQLKYLKELGDFYKLRQKPALTVKYFDQYFSLQEQIEKGQEKFKVAQYEIDQKDQQQQERITQLKQERVLQAYQLKRRNILLWFALLIVLLISGLLLFIYKQLQTNKKTLAALRVTQKQLIQSEKMASLGELTAGIAHEIQNPLNFVNNFSEVSMELVDEMEEELEKGDVKEASAIATDIKQNLEKIRHHGKRADGIVKGMLQHSRNNSGERQLTDVNNLADEYLRLSYHGLRAKDKTFNATMTTHYQENLPKTSVVPQDIGRVLLNLFNNAFYATQQKQKTAGSD